jgi:2-methylcitrate dehydratase PrpD
VETASQQYAQLFCGLQISDVPAEVLDKVKRHVMDMIAVVLVGTTAPGIEPVRDYVLKYGSPGRSRLTGPGGHRLDAEFAALYNGTAGLATEMDDHHVVSCHPGCSLVPAALAVAEDQDVSGEKFLLAMIASYEITTRVSMATTLSVVFDRGFQNAACYNGFGSAASTALMLGANEEQFVNAISIAGGYASGVGIGPYPQSRFHAGIPAANGIRAGRLALMGLGGSPTIFEGRPAGGRGWLRAFSQHPKPELLTEDLTGFLGIDGLRLKHAYSSTGNVAAQIEAFRTILEENSLRAEDIKSIHVGMDPMMVNIAPGGDQLESMTVTKAHFSTHLQLAVAAVKGRNDFKTLVDLSKEGFHRDPEINRIAHSVTYALDPECEAEFPEIWMCKVTVTTTDGRKFEARGFAMTEPDPETKFRTLLEPLMPNTQIDAIIEHVQSLEKLEHIDQLTQLLDLPAGR